MQKETPLFIFQVLDRETFEIVGYDKLYITGWSIAGQGGLRRFSSGETDIRKNIIFDGDILLCNEIHYQVNYHPGGFWADVGDESAYLSGVTWFEIPYDISIAEIVGNKYTHPDLWESILKNQINSTSSK